MPVAAIPIAATAMASDDRRLFEIEAEAVKLDSAIESTAGLLGDAEDFMLQWERDNPMPRPGEYECTDAEYAEWLEWLQRPRTAEPTAEKDQRAQILSTVEEIGEKPIRQILELVKEGADERRIISVAQATRQWNKRRQMSLASCSLGQIKEKFSSLTDQFYSLVDAAAKIQAATLAGVQCKARLAMLDMRTELVESIVEDLCSISDRASAPHTLRLS
jgi:hypothetical protein